MELNGAAKLYSGFYDMDEHPIGVCLLKTVTASSPSPRNMPDTKHLPRGGGRRQADFTGSRSAAANQRHRRELAVANGRGQKQLQRSQSCMLHTWLSKGCERERAVLVHWRPSPPSTGGVVAA